MRMKIKDMLSKLMVILIFFSVLNNSIGCKDETMQIPEKQDILPSKENLWVFLMAGQSNMAGRGKIETQDLITNKRIITINENNHWIVAGEPLHFYQPKSIIH